jgi:hypothetical protein
VKYLGVVGHAAASRYRFIGRGCGSGTSETLDQVKALGADAFLIEPIDPDALYEVLRSTLGQT